MVINNGQIGGQFYTTGGGLADNTILTSSVYLKALDFTTGNLYIQKKDGGFAYVGFDLTAGTVSAGLNGAIGGTITSVGDGWYRVTCTANLGTGAGTTFNVNYQFLGNGDGVKGSYIWGAQIQPGSSAGPYMYTAATAQASTLAIGEDRSRTTGGYNSWIANNFSVTAGAGNDSLVGSPTNYGTDTGLGGQVRGNYSTLNVTDINSSIALVGNGNLEFTQNSNGTIGIRRSTIAITSGKWYFEAVPANVTAFSTQHTIGIVEADHSLSNYVGSGANGYAYRPDGNRLNNGSATAYGTTTTANTDVVMVAFDADNWKIWFGKNGTWFASGDPVAGTNAAFSSIVGGTYLFAVGSQHTGFGAATWITNFGQRPFAYTAPSGFKALCTQNLTQPTIQKPSTAMDVVTYTGTGATQSITGLGFSPDLVWTKGRSLAQSHNLFDTLRSGFRLRSDTTGAEASTTVTLDSNGFTLGTETESNNNTSTFVAWSWDAGSTNSTNTSGSITSTVRANTQAGFSIVSYTGNGTAGATVGHGLGVAPKMIIVKNRITAGFDWVTYHQNMNASPQGGYVSLNATIAFTSNTGIWNNVAPSSSVFTLGTNTAVNKNAEGHIAYCFAEIEGYSKFGSYTGNNSTDGPFVWCGFRPKYILIKNATSTGAPWLAYDSVRSSYNAQEAEIRPNTSEAENGFTLVGSLDFLSNGFKIREDNNTSWLNTPSATFIFAAFAESPFKYARAR